VWGTVIFQQSCTDLNPDYLAAALALGGAVLALDDRKSSVRLYVASLVFVVAALTKITSAAFAIPVAASLLADGRRTAAASFTAAFAFGCAIAIATVDIVSAGHFHDSFLATATVGITRSDIWRAVPKFGWELAIKPFDVAVPFGVAAWCTLTSGRRSWANAYLVTAMLVAIVIFVSPGTASNHLVDLQMASTLVVGVALARRIIPMGVGTTVYAVLATMLLVISIPLPGVPSVVSDVEAARPRPREAAHAIHAEFLAPGAPYLSMDPIVPILNGERPWLLDYSSLERMYVSGAPVGHDFASRVREKFFTIIVLPGSNDFPRDMMRGEPGFAEAATKYWAGYDSPLAGVLRSAYTLHAARRPFVILVPSTK
jgi:hypothetical protein